MTQHLHGNIIFRAYLQAGAYSSKMQHTLEAKSKAGSERQSVCIMHYNSVPLDSLSQQINRLVQVQRFCFACRAEELIASNMPCQECLLKLLRDASCLIRQAS